jgi:hypothetical protein
MSTTVHLLRTLFTGGRHRIEVSSQALEWLSYDFGQRSLQVKFRGGRCYEYGCVSLPTFLRLLRAESKGRYFGHAVRGRCPYRSIPEQGQLAAH